VGDSFSEEVIYLGYFAHPEVLQDQLKGLVTKKFLIEKTFPKFEKTFRNVG